MLVALVASAGAARLFPGAPACAGGALRLRGGKAAAAAQEGFPKIVDEWQGDTKDLGIGAGIGFGVGLVIGTAIKATTNLAAFMRAQFAATVFLHKLGIVEIHPWKITRFIPSPIVHLFDTNGDGKIDGKDAMKMGWTLGKGALKKADLNGDGKIDESDVQMVFSSNEHAALGTTVGFLVGVVKGSGFA